MRFLLRIVLSVLSFAPSVLAVDQSVPHLVKNEAGWTLVDGAGMTLYTNERDTGAGPASCDQACLQLWPPLLAPADAIAQEEISVLVRPEVNQWAYRGRALHRYVLDRRPGNIFGDDFQHVWRAVFVPMRTPADIGISKTAIGMVLSDAEGKTLYRRLRGSGCRADCARIWKPLRASAIALPIDDFTIVSGEDGTSHWAHNGKALFLYKAEVRPGDASGEGVDGDWSAAVLVPTPPNPSWVTIQNSDMGPVFADRAGLTLYSFSVDGDLAKLKSRTCNDECLARAWRPVVAASNAQDIGNWSVVTDESGFRQWAYMGRLVVLHSEDHAPGDIKGDKFAGAFATTPRDGWWRPITPRDAHRSKQDKD